MADKESTIKTIFALDGETKYKDAIKDINREQSGLRAEMSKIDAAYKINGDRVQYNKDKVEILNKQVDLQKRRVDETRNAMEQASKVYGENSEEAQKYRTQLTRAETGLMKLEEELRKSTEELKKQETALYQAGQSAIETGEKWQSAGEKMGQAGMAMTKGVTAPLAAIAAASTAAFIEVDQSLDDIVKATGATGAELENLHQVWENVVTTMPIDLSAASDAVGELNTQFGTFGDELEDQTRLTVQFAEITGQDVVGAVQGAKKAIELFGLETEDYGRVLDIVAKASQDTGVSVDKIWDAVKRGAPALKELDLDVEESVLLLSQLEQSGLDANKAIGYLGRAEATLAKDGVSLAEGLREFGEVVESSASHTDKLAQASELFGTRGAVFMLEAAEQGKLDFDALADAAGGAAGTVESTFEATLDPIDGFKTAMNNAKIAGAELSTAIQTAAAPMIEGLVGVLQGAVTKFQELPVETQEFIVKIGALIGAIGPLLTVGGKLTSWVGDLTTGWGNLLTKMAGSEGILSGVIEKFGAGGTLGLAGAAVAAAGAIALIIIELTKIDPALKAAREAMEKADKSAKEASDSFTAQANQIERYRDELFELMDVEDKSEVQKQRLANVVERMNELMPELNLEYEKETDQLNLTKGAIDGVIDATRERLREAARSTIIQSYLEAEEGILVDIAEKYRQQMQLEDSLQKIEEARNQALLTGLSEYEINMLSMSEAQQKAAGFSIELTEAQDEAMKRLTQTVEEQKDEVGRFTEMSTEGWGSVGGAVTNLTTEIGRLDTEQTDLKDTMEDLITEGERAADAFDIMSEETDNLGETTQDTADDIEDGQDRIASAVEDSAERQEIALEDLEKASEKHKNSMNGFTKERFDYEKGTTDEFMAMWEEELTAFESYHENLQIIASKVGPDVAAELEKLGPQAAGLIQQFVDGTDADLARLADLVGERTGAAVTQAETQLGLLGGVGSTAGKDLVDGLVSGMQNNQSKAGTAAGNVGGAIERGLRQRLEIASPSKIGIEIGRNLVESLGLGMDQGEDDLARTAKGLGNTMVDAMTLPDIPALSRDNIFMRGLVGLEEQIESTTDGIDDGYDRQAKAAEDSAKRQQEAQEALEKATEQHKNAMSGFTKERFDYEKGTTKQFMDMWEAELTAFRNYHNNLTIIASKVGPDVAAELEKLGPQAAGLIQQFIDGSDEGLKELANVVRQRTNAAVVQVKLELGGLYDDGKSAGEELMSGFSDGIKSKQPTAVTSAYNAGKAVERSLKQSMQISSPSKIGIEIGRNLVESLGLGMDQGEDDLARTAKGLGNTMVDAMTLPDIPALSRDNIFMRGLVGLEEAVDDTAGTVDDSYDAMAESAEDAARRQATAQKNLEDASEKHKNAMNGFTKERFDYEKGTTKDFIKMWEDEVLAFQNYHTNLQIIASKVGPDVAELAKLGPEAAGLIQQFVDGSDEDLLKLAGIVHDRTEAAVTAAELELGRLADIGEGAGKDFTGGIVSGIKAGQGLVAEAARNVGRAAENALKNQMQISSPSKVGIDIGRNYAESTGIGIDRGTDKPKRSAAELAQAIIDSTQLSSLDRLVAAPGGGHGPVTVISQGAAQPGPVLSPSVTVNMYGPEASPAHMAREAEIMLERFTHS